LTTKAKVWLAILIFAGITFLGGINIRFIIGNQLLNFDEFSFRTDLQLDEQNMIFRLLSYSSLVIMGAYLVLFVSAIMFLINYKVDYRKEVWLLMCAIIFFLFSPVEFYSSYLDFRFYLLYLQPYPDWKLQLELFGRRIGFLKGVPWIGVLGYYTIILLAIFKPLRKSKEEIDKEDKEKESYSYDYLMQDDDE
jgi:hypothetical protein